MQMLTPDPGDSSSRFEKSLGLLTTKFVTLLQEADGGILDLKVVSFLKFMFSIRRPQKSMKSSPLIWRYVVHKRQIDGEDIVNFRGLLTKCEL